MTTKSRKTSPKSASPIGHKFKNPHLLELALTHRSLSYETNREALADPGADNEQLEFVGDAVLGMVIAESLYRLFPNSREGELTRLRASIVSRRHLAAMALQFDLGAQLRLGKGEERSGGRTKPGILANAIEAVIAALYLDAGLPAASAFIERYILEPALPSLHNAMDPASTFSGAVGDHKSALQERLQATGQGQPQYILTGQTGPDHQKRFHVEVQVTGPDGTVTRLAEAEGATKKEAQQEAARISLLQLPPQRPDASPAESALESSPESTHG